MFRDVEELRKINDEKFNKISKHFYKKIEKYVGNNIVNQYIAYFIGNGYKMSSLWSTNLDSMIEHALNELSEYANNEYNIKKIKDILEKEYGLKVVNDNPTEIVEINKKETK